METNSTYYTDLITKYFFGESTPDEIRELEKWVKADPANAAMFSEYQRTWKTIENARIDSSINLDHEWNTLVSKLKSKEAAIRPTIHKLKGTESEIGNLKSRLIYFSLRIAAVFLLLAIPTFLLYRYLAPPAEMQFAAGNEVTELVLPDGTMVTLNAGAILSYPSRFEGSFRNVTLQGEAWFEVSPDKLKPFVIASENVRIRVVGTSFFVNTKTWDGTKEIILETGKVNVYYENRPEKMAILSPGEKAELITNGFDIIKTTNEDVNFLSWKTKHIVFNNTPLNEAVALLAKVYHTKIRLSDDRLSDCRITTTFDKQSPESILNVLKATLDLQIRNTGAGIELSGRGCR